MTEEQLLELAKVFGKHQDRTLSTVGTYAAADGKFFTRIKRGTSPRGNTIRKVASWFDENWPEDLEWPSSIDRPSRAAKSGRAA